jgi:hypothetical protein
MCDDSRCNCAGQAPLRRRSPRKVCKHGSHVVSFLNITTIQINTLMRRPAAAWSPQASVGAPDQSTRTAARAPFTRQSPRGRGRAAAARARTPPVAEAGLPPRGTGSHLSEPTHPRSATPPDAGSSNAIANESQAVDEGQAVAAADVSGAASVLVGNASLDGGGMEAMGQSMPLEASLQADASIDEMHKDEDSISTAPQASEQMLAASLSLGAPAGGEFRSLQGSPAPPDTPKTPSVSASPHGNRAVAESPAGAHTVPAKELGEPRKGSQVNEALEAQAIHAQVCYCAELGIIWRHWAHPPSPQYSGRSMSCDYRSSARHTPGIRRLLNWLLFAARLLC